MEDLRKTIKFDPDLVPLILSGEKTATWRLWDEKNIQAGDIVAFVVRPQLTVFTLARITSAIEKSLKDLTPEDKQGQAPFASDEQMYKVFSSYYKRPVTPETPVKIIRFELLKKS